MLFRSKISGPGWRYKWYAFAKITCAPSSRIDSGRTDLTEALVPTGMKVGVWIFPCGVEIVPTRALPNSFSISNLNDTGANLAPLKEPDLRVNSCRDLFQFCCNALILSVILALGLYKTGQIRQDLWANGLRRRRDY